jgi:hypothetical protein
LAGSLTGAYDANVLAAPTDFWLLLEQQIREPAATEHNSWHGGRQTDEREADGGREQSQRHKGSRNDAGRLHRRLSGARRQLLCLEGRVAHLTAHCLCLWGRLLFFARQTCRRFDKR